MAKSRFLLVLILVAAVALCIPYDPKVTPLLITGRLNAATISVTGNSVLSHISKCDQDGRSLVTMMANETGQAILDLSFSGQSLSESANLAAVSLKNPHIQTVLFPISLFELTAWDTDQVRAYGLFRLINPELLAASFMERARSPNRFSGAEEPLDGPFDYRGKHYPDYRLIKTAYFNREKAAMPCPENDGADLEFVRANYHHMVFERDPDQRVLPLIASLGKDANQRAKSLVVIILPIDVELMTRLGLPDASALQEKIAGLVQTLAADGVTVIDLSASLHNSDFADRWCACGHLVDSGRLAVAQAVGRRLRDQPREFAAHYE